MKKKKLAGERKEKGLEQEVIVEVKNLTKKFKDFVAVNDVSFQVHKSEVFAFLGPNGAGKTTTIKMLTTLLKPTSGQIILNGFDVSKNPDAARNSFGIVFQDQSIDDELTAYENMKFHCALYKIPTNEAKGRIETLLKLVELWDRKDEFVKRFSGGMKRRLELARGLLHKPKILFLDEPTQGLDPQTRNHIWEYIVDLSKKEGMTVFLTTHYMEEAEKIADRIVIMDKGKIVAHGTTKELETRTKTKDLEAAFIKLTGYKIREEEASVVDRMRLRRSIGRR